MNLFTKDDLEKLVEKQEEPCVSMFTPLRRGGTATETQQNQTRLKNRLSEAENHLHEMGLRDKELEDFLDPIYTILHDAPFWKQDSDGLALFLSPDTFRYYRLPASFEELTVVSDEFHVKPLIPLLTGDGRFYVLALSRNDVRLLQCTRHDLREVSLNDTPTSLDEFLKYDVPEKQLEVHAGGKSGFHGRGDIPDGAMQKRKVTLFVRQVQKSVHKLISNQNAPLVLAGVEEMRSLYKEACNNENVMEEGLNGNADKARAEDLHSEAWEIVEPYFKREQDEAVEMFQRLAGSERASDDLEDIIRAAYIGRVETLLADLDTHCWGTYDRDTDTFTYHDEEQAGDEDLLDIAAVQTLLHGGSVFALHSEEMPRDDSLAAVFRY